MFIARKLLLAILGLGFAFIVTTCQENKKKYPQTFQVACKDKQVRHHNRW